MILPERLLRLSQKRAIKVFKRFAKNVPFYRRYLQISNVRVSSIKTFDDFKRSVPILDKDLLFIANYKNIKEILPHHSLKKCLAILPSSGFSGSLSFGINALNDARLQERHVDLMLNYVFDVKRKRTLLINALCMGVNVPSKMVTSVTTGPREDIVLSLVKIFSKEFDQTIIIGDNCLIKNVIEKGIEDGIKWENHRTRLVVGGDSFPVNFRSYLAHLMKIDLEKEEKIIIGSSFGIAEIGINILWETPNTIRIRRAASNDSKLRAALLGREEELCPMLFQYNPLRVCIEESAGRLLFTNLSSNSRIPIIRYASGDMGTIIPHEQIAKTLIDSGLHKYIPSLRLPVIALRERSQHINVNGRMISPDMIKNAFYSDFHLPGLLTGNFTIAQSEKKLVLDIQLKDGASLTNESRKRFEAAVARCLPGIHFEFIFYQYREFQIGMGLDYERKFKHMRHHHLHGVDTTCSYPISRSMA